MGEYETRRRKSEESQKRNKGWIGNMRQKIYQKGRDVDRERV